MWIQEDEQTSMEIEIQERGMARERVNAHEGRGFSRGARSFHEGRGVLMGGCARERVGLCVYTHRHTHMRAST